jgi:diguanylate cyclase (GGDEF)-like protein/PAS domain S-box-containing protein/putative nucleotidyltransferase with HDIG domain
MEVKKDELTNLVTRLETIIDNFPFDVWFKDADGKYLFVNQNFESYSGKKKEELLGKCDHDLYSKTEADIYVASDMATIRGKIQDYYEAEYQPGKYKEEFKKPVFDELGNLIGTTGFSRDISDRRKINDALIESERSKSVLISNLPGVAYRCNFDEDLTMTFISEGCYDLTGYTSEELIIKNPSYYDLILPEYRNALLKKWREEEIGFNFVAPDEYPIKTATGEIKWVWEQYQELYDSKQNIWATEGLIIDITERKLAEEDLKESEERFRTMFEEAPLGIGIFDSITGKAYQVNSRFTEIIGRIKEEVLSMSWDEYTYPDDIKENLHKMNLLNSGKLSGFSLHKRFIKPDGSIIWANVTIAPFKHKSNNSCHLCMIEDITERKHAEEEILYLSYYDQLTGLYNRRYYEETLQRIDTKRNLPITLVMADLNGLKLINDAFGHFEGDRLLKIFADIIKSECRADDIAARTGGDEFVILMPKTDLTGAEKLIERINISLSNERINNIICSASFGWATKRQEKEEIASVYMYAEDLMYRHKLSESTSMRNETIRVITKTLFEKNKREQLHCERVSKLCEKIGKVLNMNPEDVNELKTAGLLHDIGKINIDEKILNKEGKLTEMEWAELKRHPEIGYQILRSVNEFAPIAEYVLYHHERIDG